MYKSFGKMTPYINELIQKILEALLILGECKNFLCLARWQKSHISLIDLKGNYWCNTFKWFLDRCPNLKWQILELVIEVVAELVSCEDLGGVGLLFLLTMRWKTPSCNLAKPIIFEELISWIWQRLFTKVNMNAKVKINLEIEIGLKLNLGT